ncbi:MAG: hypothetical protein ACQKBT_11375, partial [Puniceicoccales bacterium]
MALILLLMVSVSALLRVEQGGAAARAEMILAERNALFALTVAIGELQKFSGPDQRVSTTADLLANVDSGGDATPVSIYPETSPRLNVSAGSRYWTGIWGNDQAVIGYDLRPDEMPVMDGNVRGMSPVLMTWLVSGNEGASFDFDGIEGGVDVAGGPGVNSTVSFGPDATISWVGDDAPTIAGERAVVLVGEGSADDDGAGDHGSHVVAPLVGISDSEGQSAGLYAWWVGDEGVKARVDLRTGASISGDSEDEIGGFLISQRSGVEFMEGEVTYSVDSSEGAQSVSVIGDDFDATDVAIENISMLSEFPLLGMGSAARGRLQTGLKKNFHDMTVGSFGVLSDTYAGGLRKDLTADFADLSSGASYRPEDDDPIFLPISDSENHLPTWGHLRSWARTHPDTNGEIEAQPATDTEAGLAPVLNYFAIGWDVRTFNNTLNVYMTPVAVLYNPYPVTLKGETMEVGIKVHRDALLDVRTAPRKPDSASDSDVIPFATKAYIDLGRGEITETNLGDYSEYLDFTIEGQDLPGGESHIYYLDSSLFGQTYSDGMRLVRAPEGEEANPVIYFMMEGSGTIPLSEEDDAYLQVVGLNTEYSSDNLRWTGASYEKGVKADLRLGPVGSISGDGDVYHETRSVRIMEFATGRSSQIIVDLGS